MDWNQTKLMTLSRCGERYRREYEEKEWHPQRVPLVRGIAFHSVSRTTYLRKMQDGAYPTVEEVRDCAADEFEREWARDEVLIDRDDADEAGSQAAVRADAKDFVVDVAAFDRTAVAPSITPIAVERKVVVRPLDSEIVIHGTMDLAHGTEGRVTIIDKKTSARSPAKDMADKSIQHSMYGLLWLAEHGKPPDDYRNDVLVRTPKKHDLKYVPLPTTRTLDDLQTMVRRINVAVRAVEHGVYLPAAADSYWCSEKMCPYFPCQFVARGVRPSN